jgi:phosphoribosyl-ATP pyrophosphohydrolase/phosphoribosyl-AMP cyclohydrolase/histidinol dehydrogenase
MYLCLTRCVLHILVCSRTLQGRKASAPAGSYSAKLFNDPKLLAAKILEEARELVESKDADETAWEAADLVFFAAAACVRDNITLADVESHLERRTLKVQRRAGLAKPAEAAAAEKILASKESTQSS